ncbi:hypothetical protein PR048_005020 [Dryococelus australis]|uniref:Zinc finger MYM-type protein 1-like n=1 Tax=Dryococelus australis TaxID=614101 RepID=A0ABQ9I713_9NEOP|nr:hypothetical protein PR048_005020 [Dryococelus australis]
MLIIQNGCVTREYCLKFVLLYDLRGKHKLAIMELPIISHSCVFRCASHSLNLALIQAIKFVLISLNLRSTFLYNVKNTMRNEATTKFNVFFFLQQLNGHKTILKSQFRGKLENMFSGRTTLQTVLNNFGGSEFPSLSWIK